MAMKRTDRTENSQRGRSPNFLSATPRPAATGRGMVAIATTANPGDWFAQGCEHEDAERFHEAMRCYRRALEESGSSASTCFNLANVLYRLRRKVEAVQFYRQALEHDEESPETWNNLGVVLCELKQCDEATRAFQRAIMLAPWFADPLYNLADCLDERGHTGTARRYWQDYLRLDVQGAWSDYARSRLT